MHFVIWALLGYYASFLPGILTLVDGTDMLSRNISRGLSRDTA
jgi:hypothetical protein